MIDPTQGRALLQALAAGARAFAERLEAELGHQDQADEDDERQEALVGRWRGLSVAERLRRVGVERDRALLDGLEALERETGAGPTVLQAIAIRRRELSDG